MRTLYADVVIDISSGDLDRVFSYRIPDRLIQEAAVGQQVEVPFGKSNRIVKGFVVNLSDHPEYEPEKTKEVLSITNRELAIEGQLIRLAWQIRKVYGGTMNQALKTVLPVKRQIRAKEKKYYCLTQDVRLLEDYCKRIESDRRYKARTALIQALWKDENQRENRAYTLEELPASRGVIQALVQDGILIETVRTQYRQPVKQIFSAHPPVSLSPTQQEIVDRITSDEQHRTHLIYGVTGSGKTEVYIELAARMIAEGKQAIILIPEIALSMQMVSRFYSRFADRVSVMNSRLSEGEKYDQFLRAKRGDLDIVIGPRSALFMPFERLGLIVMDEEHDGAYKSDLTPKYHAREVASWRARMAGAKLVLGSATPSMESYSRALKGQYGMHVLKVRAAAQSRLPEVAVVDLREEFKLKNRRIFSRKLLQLMEETLAKGEQVMLFLNRRGYAGFVSCRSCGHVFTCKHCEVSMTAHQNGRLKCHYCGYEEPYPQICPECGSVYVGAFGMGTQKVEQMTAKEFPQARVLRLDRDSTSKKGSMEEILERFGRHEADILVGTQMIVKGHDFPDVTLVGVLAADLSMFSGDYLAAERTFELLTQAAGRAGRDEKPGRVIIQTYQPDHYSIRCAQEQNFEEFYWREMQYRTLLQYPPVSHMMAVLVTSPDMEVADACSRSLAAAVTAYAHSNEMEGISMIGPSDAAVARGKDQYRKVFYIKSKKITNLVSSREYMEQYLHTLAYAGMVGLQFDVDPMSLY